MKNQKKNQKEIIRHGQTWLEPEELTYPSGGFLRRARVRIRPNCYDPHRLLPYGELRIVKASIPDAYFTIPARLRTKGKTIRGFIHLHGDDDIAEFVFIPHL